MKHPLQQALDDYLALRRSLGFKLHDEGLQLPRFLVFLQKNKGRLHHRTSGPRLDNAISRAGANTAAENGAWICPVHYCF
jgi:hypothetical protein